MENRGRGDGTCLKSPRRYRRSYPKFVLTYMIGKQGGRRAMHLTPVRKAESACGDDLPGNETFGVSGSVLQRSANHDQLMD